MAIEIVVPKLGLTMKEATLVRWGFGPGEKVAAEEIVLVLETDKVTYEMPSPGAGLLHPLVAAGETIQVSQVVGYLAADEAELKKLAAEAPAAAVGAVAESAPPEEAAPPAAASQAAEAAVEGRVKASPLARAMAKEHGLELNRLQGSGPGGRIIRADVAKALEEGLPARPAAVPPVPSAEEELGLSPAQVIPIQGVRRIIFENMRLSLQSQAQLTIHTEASASQMVALRQALNQRSGPEGGKVSLNAILVKAIAQALKLHPYVNVSVEGEEIKVWAQIHVGVAMDLGEGLIVPKVRRPDLKSIREISRDLDELVDKAKSKRLLPDDLQGGTFTLTNMGAWDVDDFTPIINPPESAILGAGRVVDKPAAREGQVVIEPRLSLSLTFDHRVIDGAPAARFLKTLKDMIELPGLMIG